MADLSLEDQNFVVRQTELIAELEENVFEGDVILKSVPPSGTRTTTSRK